jgi:hypothetical protein
MVHVDSRSRNPVPVGSVNTNDWVCGVQYHDEDLQLIKSQVLNNEAEKMLHYQRRQSVQNSRWRTKNYYFSRRKVESS